MDYLASENRMSAVESYIGHMISDMAGLGWATHGHSAVDVNLYSYGYMSENLRGNHENTDIGKFIERQLGLLLDPITWKLRDSIVREEKNLKESTIRHIHS